MGHIIYLPKWYFMANSFIAQPMIGGSASGSGLIMYDRYYRRSPFDTEAIIVPQCAAIWVTVGYQNYRAAIVQRGNSIDIMGNGGVAGTISLNNDGTKVSIRGTNDSPYVYVTFVLLGYYDYKQRV